MRIPPPISTIPGVVELQRVRREANARRARLERLMAVVVGAAVAALTVLHFVDRVFP